MMLACLHDDVLTGPLIHMRSRSFDFRECSGLQLPALLDAYVRHAMA